MFRNDVKEHFQTSPTFDPTPKAKPNKRQENLILAAKQNNVVYIKKNLQRLKKGLIILLTLD